MNETEKLYNYIKEYCPHGLVNKLQLAIRDVRDELLYTFHWIDGLFTSCIDVEDIYYCFLCALEVFHGDMIQLIKDCIPYSNWPRLVWDD